MSVEESPRPGTTADLVRRVDRLEVSQSELTRSVASLEGVTKLVQLEQSHLRELMTARFAGLEATQAQQTMKLDSLVSLLSQAMADPMNSTPQSKSIYEEYRQFQHEVREGLRAREAHDETVDDYILVQKTKSETTSTLAQRAFGGSVLGAVGGIIGVVLGAIALLGR